FDRKLGSRLRAAAGIAHEPGVIADDDHDGMAELLELAQLGEADRVSEVDIGRRGVKALLDAQRLISGQGALELADEALLGQDLFRAFADRFEMTLDARREHGRHASKRPFRQRRAIAPGVCGILPANRRARPPGSWRRALSPYAGTPRDDCAARPLHRHSRL